MKKIIVTMKRFNLRAILPGGKMPPSTAGRDARRHIFRHALKPSTVVLIFRAVGADKWPLVEESRNQSDVCSGPRLYWHS
jgi:hypothetical protein